MILLLTQLISSSALFFDEQYILSTPGSTLISQVLTLLSTALFVLAPGHILTMWPLGALQQTSTYSVYLPWNHLIIQPAKIMVYDNTTRSQGWCAYHYPGLHPHRAVEQTKSPSNPVRVGKQDHNMVAKGNHTRMCIYSWYLHCCSSASLILIIAAVIFSGHCRP